MVVSRVVEMTRGYSCERLFPNIETGRSIRLAGYERSVFVVRYLFESRQLKPRLRADVEGLGSK